MTPIERQDLESDHVGRLEPRREVLDEDDEPFDLADRVAFPEWWSENSKTADSWTSPTSTGGSRSCAFRWWSQDSPSSADRFPPGTA